MGQAAKRTPVRNLFGTSPARIGPVSGSCKNDDPNFGSSSGLIADGSAPVLIGAIRSVTHLVLIPDLLDEDPIRPGAVHGPGESRKTFVSDAARSFREG
jgi:hypothetical protein